jgi:hypothetical protein
MSTDRFLREAMLDSEDVSLSIKQIDLESLPIPEGFKVTFEHMHPGEDEALEHSS